MTKLIENVDAVVRHVLGGMSLKDSMTLADIRDVICEVRRRIETQYDSGSTARTTGLYRFMLPDSESMANEVTQVAMNLRVVFDVCVCNKANRSVNRCCSCWHVL